MTMVFNIQQGQLSNFDLAAGPDSETVDCLVRGELYGCDIVSVGRHGNGLGQSPGGAPRAD